MLANRNKEIGEDELRGVLRGFPHGDDWKTAFKASLGVTELDSLLVSRGGKLRDADKDEVVEVDKLAGELRAGTHAGVPDTIKTQTKDQLTAEIMKILASARKRLPQCLERQHAAAGMRKSKDAASPMDAESMWSGVALQRLFTATHLWAPDSSARERPAWRRSAGFGSAAPRSPEAGSARAGPKWAESIARTYS